MQFLLFVFISILIFLISKRRIAKSTLKMLKEDYDCLMLTRKVYHKAKFIEDEAERKEIQDSCIRLHRLCVKSLEDDSIIQKCKPYLTKKELTELKEILKLPRYELL